jgi:hypothetical protein
LQEAAVTQLSTGLSEEPKRLVHDDDAVMSFKAWCDRNDISTATGRRIIQRGEGPEVIRLSTNRIGVTYGADRAWKESRRRVSTAVA